MEHVENLDTLHSDQIRAIYRRTVKKTSDGVDRADLIAGIRKYYQNKGIVEKEVDNSATKREKENYSFDYHFSEKELQEKGRQLARASAERTAIEDEKKSAMSAFKDKLDSKQSEINIISRHINEGYEYVTKTCEVEKDFDKGTKTYYHEGISVGTEKMTEADYQLKAEFTEEPVDEEGE